MFGVPGIILQIIGRITMVGAFGNSIPSPEAVGFLILLVSTILLIVGLSFYAKAKGHHPAFGLLGFLSIIGLIILAIMPDKRK